MMSSSLVLSQPQEILLALQSGTQATIRSTKGHQHVCKQTSSEGGEIVESARIGINTYLQSGLEEKDRIKCVCCLRVCIRSLAMFLFVALSLSPKLNLSITAIHDLLYCQSHWALAFNAK